MRGIFCLLVFGLAPIGTSSAADPAPSAAQILEQADHYRAGWSSLVLVSRISNYKGNRLEDQSQYEVYLKDRTKSFVKFMDARDRGRSLLVLEDDMWIYIPSTSRPIRITPMQRLTGNVSNGDVARTNYSGDYEPVLLREETFEGKECYVLELTAKRKGATYPKIDYWISKAEFAPCKAEFFLTSGKNHKTALFDAFADFHGKRLVARMTIYDKIRRDEKSAMEYLRYTPQEIPDKYFNKNSMGSK